MRAVAHRRVSPEVSSPPKRRMQLPYALQKQGGRLLHQQCWLWGQDIRCRDGNVLLASGFAKVRPPEGMEGSTQYSIAVDGGMHVRLWGFGVFYGAAEGIFLNRYAFQPRAIRMEEPVWQAKWFQRAPRSGDLKALAMLVDWIAGYEASVLERFGAEYRARCIAGWSGRALQPMELVPAWRALGREVAAHAHVAELPGARFGGTSCGSSAVRP